ncbi:MAG TPA: hypothetical protein VGI56_01595 [Galbitalea sp.]
MTAGAGGRAAAPRSGRRRRDLTSALLALLTATLLTACTPQPIPSAAPSPTPTTVELSQLTLTPAGLTDLDVGKPVPADNRLVKYSPTRCPTSGGWLTLYPQDTNDSSGQPLDPFDVVTEHGNATSDVTTVFVWSKQIATPEGIRVGSTQAQVLAAYPNAKHSVSYATDVYAVPSSAGTLVIEVAGHNSFAKGEWPTSELGTVVWMFALQPNAPVASIAGNNDAGPCPTPGHDPGDID